MPCPDEFIALAEQLAEVARTVTQRYFRSPFTVDSKADATPVTIADREAETALRAAITAAYPDHGLIGEEFGPERPDADYVWVFDPIDGTKRFITGNPTFGTLIALTLRGQPILGIIDMPALDERWIGASGHATFFQDKKGRNTVTVRACPGLAEASLYATTPEMFKGDDFPAFERVRQSVKTPMYGGECYAYGLLASGFVDLVVEADMGIYDYMALAPVVAGAGGIMTDWQGQPLTLDSDGKVIAAGDSRCHEAALTKLNPG